MIGATGGSAVRRGGGPQWRRTNSPQVATADWKTGPLNVVPSTDTEELPGGLETAKASPLGPLAGSGKFGTPCDRMHCATASWESDEACVLEVVEDPHAAMRTTAATADAVRVMTAEQPGDRLGESPRTCSPPA
jgi:hypothetical protein